MYNLFLCIPSSHDDSSSPELLKWLDPIITEKEREGLSDFVPDQVICLAGCMNGSQTNLDFAEEMRLIKSILNQEICRSKTDVLSIIRNKLHDLAVAYYQELVSIIDVSSDLKLSEDSENFKLKDLHFNRISFDKALSLNILCYEISFWLQEFYNRIKKIKSLDLQTLDEHETKLFCCLKSLSKKEISDCSWFNFRVVHHRQLFLDYFRNNVAQKTVLDCFIKRLKANKNSFSKSKKYSLIASETEAVKNFEASKNQIDLLSKDFFSKYSDLKKSFA